MTTGAMWGWIGGIAGGIIGLAGGASYLQQAAGDCRAVFRHHSGMQAMDRFTLRGRIKVNIQWLLYCLVHNIEKIVNFGKSCAMAAA